MHILSVHNRYLIRGGEDEVFESEVRLLTENGCRVTTVIEQNSNPDSITKKLGYALDCVWSRAWYRKFQAILADAKPDVVHVHNFFPLISPSIYYACRKAKVPVVQTLHNYRLLCPAATFYREGQICEECLHHGLSRSVRYACYQGSRPGTAAIAAMIKVHRTLGTWSNLVDRYIALTGFCRDKLIEGGLPESRIVVKPNFVLPDPGMQVKRGQYAIFVGRLVDPKGLPALLSACRQIGQRVRVVIIGDGPSKADLEAAIQTGEYPGVSYRGRLPRSETMEAIKSARFLIFPSGWYEGFPMTIAESFACGVPVICSGMGSMQEIVADGVTGLHFRAGDADDLARKIEWAWNHADEMETMGRTARREFETKYAAEQNFVMLKNIYDLAIASREGRAPVRVTVA
jgi:glycosyltransferase involved in cell wall biosynthesis